MCEYLYIYIYICKYLCVCIVFANGPEDQGSIPGRVIPKTLKMVLDTSMLNTQHYKVRIKGKVAIEKGAFWSPSTTVTNFIFYLLYLCIYIYTFMCVCACIYINPTNHISIYVCIQGCTYICLCIYVCICGYTCVIYSKEFSFPTLQASSTSSKRNRTGFMANAWGDLKQECWPN